MKTLIMIKAGMLQKHGKLPVIKVIKIMLKTLL